MQATANAVFKALADPTRRAIFERLARNGEMTVHALTDCSGVSQPMVSRHLGALKGSGLLRVQRRGRETYCSVRPKGLEPLIDWMSVYSAFWHDRLVQLEALLERMD